jgi:hypothetical protein
VNWRLPMLAAFLWMVLCMAVGYDLVVLLGPWLATP